MNKMLIGLSDIKTISISKWLNASPIGTDIDLIILHSYEEFKNHVTINGLPNGIVFSYDYGPTRDDIEAVKFLTRYCMNYILPLPPISQTSTDTVRRGIIDNVLNKYNEFYKSLNIVSVIKEEQIVDPFGDGTDLGLPF